jgi:hypothetical protein
MNFNFTFLGQSILRYETPLDIFTSINQTYEQKLNTLEPANKQLVGKIKDEHSLFYDGDDESKMKKHNALPQNVLNWFMQMFHHYLEFNHIRQYQTHLNSIWVNEMKAHEYNPVHVHQGNIFTGLSSVMILKLPNTYGVEYSAEGSPQNGKLQILGASNGQFAKVDYEPPMQVKRFLYISIRYETLRVSI